jgi:hypothetical protein
MKAAGAPGRRRRRSQPRRPASAARRQGRLCRRRAAKRAALVCPVRDRRRRRKAKESETRGSVKREWLSSSARRHGRSSPAYSAGRSTPNGGENAQRFEVSPALFSPFFLVPLSTLLFADVASRACRRSASLALRERDTDHPVQTDGPSDARVAQDADSKDSPSHAVHAAVALVCGSPPPALLLWLYQAGL